jgi:Subtilase family/N-acetylmuramoyl-L-alanine amidase
MPSDIDRSSPRGLRLAGVSPHTLEQARRALHSLSGPSNDGPASENLRFQRAILAYVECADTPRGEWVEQLAGLGLAVLRYQPEAAYLCRGRPEAFEAAAGLPWVAHVTPLTPELKTAVSAPESGDAEVWVLVQADPDDVPDVLAEIRALEGVEVLGDTPEAVDVFVRIHARVSGSGLGALLALPAVAGTEPYAPTVPEDEVASLVIAGRYDAAGVPKGSYESWLEDHDLSGKGVTIGVVDTGVDVAHPAFTGRIRDLASGSKDWHGTFVAGHAAGCYLAERDSGGFVYGLGTAPAAELLSQSSRSPAAVACRQTASETGPSGWPAVVQNNSWGQGTANPMTYGSLEAAYDRLVRNADPDAPRPRPLIVCFSSGNEGERGLTRPKAAKNVIVTGNSEVLRPQVGGADADDIRDVYDGEHASSHGNCADGRVRPDLVAPGEWTASANYDSHKGDVEYISERLTWGGGSSGASPKTAGACALLVEWWRRHNDGEDPSPAMVRALLVNAAEPIKAGGPIPNARQGWGRLNLDNVLCDDLHRTYVDQKELLTEAGEERTWSLHVSDPSRPVKVTLAWTDPPGNVGTGTRDISAIVNKLLLTVEAGGRRYRGNRFQNGASVADDAPVSVGQREGWDNLQNVFLPAGNDGALTVKVAALALTSDCLTGRAGSPQQDFALVVTNGFIDRGRTPADVFLFEDGDADGPAPDDPDGFWSEDAGDDADGDGTTDGKSGGAGADSRDSAPRWGDYAGEPEPSDELPSDDPFDDEGRHAPVWGEAERRPSANSAPLVSASGLLGGLGARLVTAGGAPTSEVSRSGARTSTPSLSAALATLLADWGAFGLTREGAVRARCAVLRVGPGTRISLSDLAALRRLAFAGDLYLVAEDAAVLAFLAQHIHRLRGVHLRLADGAEDVPRRVQDAAAEAAGAHRLERVDLGVGASAFDVVAADEKLVFVVLDDGDDRPPVRVTRPDGEELALERITVAGERGIRRIGVERAAVVPGPWAGRWRVDVDVTATRAPEVVAYARGVLPVTLAARLSPTAVNGDSPTAEPFLQARATDGVGITALTAHPREIERRGRVTENDRPVRADVPVSRLDRPRERAVWAEAERAQRPRARIVGAPLRLPPTTEGAVALDLPTLVEGVDPTGAPFARRLHGSVVRLEPRSLWRRRRGRLVPGLGRPVWSTPEAGANGNSGAGTEGGIDEPLPDIPTVESASEAEYPHATRYVQAKYYRRPALSRRPSQIVIHITDSNGTINGIIRWFQDPYDPDLGQDRKVSAHYVVGQDGEVVQMVKHDDIALHANTANRASIGIEHVANTRGMAPTAIQYASSAALVRWLCEYYDLPMDRSVILGHSEADPITNHYACPNAVWDWDYYMQLITEAMSLPEPEPWEGEPDPWEGLWQ